MELFFELEIAYIVIGLFVLAVTAFVTTRDFVPRVAFKRGMLGVGGLIILMITAHYYITTQRMDGVKKIFNEGGTVICENKMHRTISRSVLISKKLEWELDGDYFFSKNHMRKFHTARCIDYAPIDSTTRKTEQ